MVVGGEPGHICIARNGCAAPPIHVANDGKIDSGSSTPIAGTIARAELHGDLLAELVGGPRASTPRSRLEYQKFVDHLMMHRLHCNLIDPKPMLQRHSPYLGHIMVGQHRGPLH